MPTIDDVAKACGLAKSTVSLVINNSPNKVSKKTRARVLQVVREMNFHPSAHARSLSNQRARMIGIVTKRVPHLLTDVYYSAVIDAILESATDFDQTVAVYNGRIWRDKEQTQLVFADARCDGLLLLMAGNDQHLIEALQQRRIPFVTVNSGVRQEGVNSIDIDNVEAGYRMTRYLIDQGHRRIACLHTGVDIYSQDRLQGYRLALEKTGLPYDEALAFAGHPELGASGYDCGRWIAERLPGVTAVFAATDRLASDAVAGLKDSGRRVPADVSVVGINDTVDARRCNPPLTTLSQSVGTLGNEALGLLLKLIEEPKSPAQHVVWPTEIVVRESVTALR
jgi:LacI family transcriptional regulator